MRQEQPMDMAVELSKTMWAASVRLSSEMDKVEAGLLESLPGWVKVLVGFIAGRKI